MTAPVVAGTYALWFDAGITGNGLGTYGVYIDGVLQDFDRELPGMAASISLVNGILVVTSSGTMSIRCQMTSDAITVRRASFILQKIA